MRMWGFALAALALLAVGCADDSSPSDGGLDASSDSTVDADSGDANLDTGPPVCPSSSVDGCHEACQQIYDCVVTSSVAPSIEGVLSMLGFEGDDFSDCSPCVTTCEEGAVPGVDDDVLACLETMMEARSCEGSPDPTVITESVNACCEGETDSFFCRQTCRAVWSTEGTAELFPVCRDLLSIPLAPDCAGTCPDVTGFALGVVLTGEGSDIGVRTADVDPVGRIAIGGQMEGTVDFGGGPITSETGSEFVAVYEPDGTHAWSRKLTDGRPLSVGTDLGNNIMFDDEGNLFVFANLIGTADFGDGERTAVDRDAVLLSYDPDGTLRWARQGTGAGISGASEIDVRGTDVWFVGTADDTVDWGSGALPAAGGEDLIVGRFDGDGVHQWSRRYGGPEANPGFSIAAHPNGDHTIVSMSEAGIDFGDGALETMGFAWYVVRLGDDGALRWVEFVGVGESAFGYRAEAHGDAVFSQTFLFSDPLGATTDLQGTTLTASNQVTARWDETGAATWIDETRINPMSSYVAFDIEIEPDGGVVRASNLFGTIDFGAGEVTGFGQDALITRFDASGTAEWSFRMGGFLDEVVSTVDRLDSGELVAVGSFERTLDIGTETLTADERDIFVVRFAAE